jgi:hypothetical protein
MDDNDLKFVPKRPAIENEFLPKSNDHAREKVADFDLLAIQSGRGECGVFSHIYGSIISCMSARQVANDISNQ